jgi:hypothetical protein
MAIDLSGGFEISREYNFAECPAPGVRDASNMWVSDDRGALGFPRCAVECVAPGMPGASAHSYDGKEYPWEWPDTRFNLAFSDGRVYRFVGKGKKHRTEGPDGKHSVLGAGPLRFACLEPFRLWTGSFQGVAVETTASALSAGNDEGPVVSVEMHVEATMAVPPWSMGSLTGQTERHSEEERYEQLFRAKGTVRVGDEQCSFEGSGLRIRREGVRPINPDFRGHCWQSALFPSGKAFGCMKNPPGPDEFNEGYLFTGDGGLIPARVVEAPWLRKLQPSGQDATVVLESALGITTIDAETVLSLFVVPDAKMRPHTPNFPIVQQASVHYRWDGEETYGMMERSSLREIIE